MLSKKAIGGCGGVVELRVTFMGANEPSVELEHELCLSGAGGYTYYLLELEQGSDSWRISNGREASPSPAPAARPTARPAPAPQREAPQPRSLEELLLEQHGSVEAAVQVYKNPRI